MKKLSPHQVKNQKQLLTLNADSYHTDAFSIHTDGEYVGVHSIDGRMDDTSNPKNKMWNVQVPKKDFDKLIKWYIKEQKIK